MKDTHISPTTMDFPDDNTEVLVMSKDTAIKLIQDLAQDLGNTGISKLVLRTEDNRYFILQVKG